MQTSSSVPFPIYDRNERDVQWVGEVDWIYRCEVMLADSQAAQQATLCLDGLDTVANVWFNGVLLCTSDNMFVPLRVPVGGSLHAGSNALVIHFTCALRHGQALEAKYGQRAVWNTASAPCVRTQSSISLPDILIARAGEPLYAAKRQGRNRVVCAALTTCHRKFGIKLLDMR